jgi:hypothetical protein
MAISLYHYHCQVEKAFTIHVLQLLGSALLFVSDFFSICQAKGGWPKSWQKAAEFVGQRSCSKIGEICGSQNSFIFLFCITSFSFPGIEEQTKGWARDQPISHK